MNNLFYVWLIIALLFVLLEMGAPGLFFFFSFAFGAVCSAFSTFLTDSIVHHCLVFLVGTTCALWVLNLWVKRKARKYHPHQKTNIYALQGKRARVIKAIMPAKSGEVKIGGEVWAARAVHDEQIDVQEEVEVIDVLGVHVIVKPKHK